MVAPGPAKALVQVSVVSYDAAVEVLPGAMAVARLSSAPGVTRKLGWAALLKLPVPVPVVVTVTRFASSSAPVESVVSWAAPAPDTDIENWSAAKSRPCTRSTSDTRARLVFITVHAAAVFVVFRIAVMLRLPLLGVRLGDPVTALQEMAAVPLQWVVVASVMVRVRLAATTDMKTRTPLPSVSVKSTVAVLFEMTLPVGTPAPLSNW